MGAMAVVSALLLCGCAGSHQARKMNPKSAVLVNPDILQKERDDQALYRYVKPGFEIKNYSAIIIEPPIVFP
jgi:hypothetical protein